MSELVVPESWAIAKLEDCFTDAFGGSNILSTEYSEVGVGIILKSDVRPLCDTSVPSKFVPLSIVKKKYESKRVQT